MIQHDIVAVEGEFQVRRVDTKLIGRFGDKAHAELFLDALSGHASEPAGLTPGPEPEVPASDPEPRENMDTAFEAALPRLVAGEALSDVAEAVGMPWTQLRSRWARWRKDNKSEPVVPAPSVKPPRRTSGRDVEPLSAPDRVRRRAASGLSDEEELELLSIQRSADPQSRMIEFADSRGMSVGELQRLADKLLARGA